MRKVKKNYLPFRICFGLARIVHKPSTDLRKITESQRHGKPPRFTRCDYTASPAVVSRADDLQQYCGDALEECVNNAG